MKHLTTLILLLVSTLTFAQNADYRLFRDGVQYLYGDTEDEIAFGMKLEGDCDSTYAYRSGSCFTLGAVNAYASSFAGFEVCQGPDTTTMKLKGDRLVKLLPRANVGQSWLVTTEFNLPILASVDSVRLASFLGLTDSVKYISFHGETLADPTLSNIRIGKTTGLLNAVYFWNLLVCRDEEIPLNGISEPRAGLQYASAADFLEPDEGQEVHFEEVGSRLCSNNSDSSHYLYCKYKLTLENYAVSASGDSMTYTYHGSKLSYRRTMNGNQTQYDSVLQENIVYQTGIAPKEFSVLAQQPGAMVPYYWEATRQIRTIFNTTTPLMVVENDCFGEHRQLGKPYRLTNGSYSQFSDVSDGVNYVQGTGFRFQESRTLDFYQDRRLVYLKDDKRECGVPYDFSGLVSTSTLPLDHAIKLFPNPASEATTMRLPATGTYDVSLTDLHGRKLADFPRAPGELTLHVDAFPAGVYVVTVARDGQLVGRRRLVVR